MEAFKVEAGIFGALFDNPIEVSWFNTTNSWIIETYRFCRKHNIVFVEPGQSLLPQCYEDRAIMEVFHTAGYGQEEMLQLNRCRLYYKVTTVSDISDVTGTRLSIQWFTRGLHLYAQRYKWPIQGLPPRQDWELWDNALRNTLGRGSLTLAVPLGPWLHRPNTQTCEFLLARSGNLYQRDGDGWIRYECVQANRRSQRYPTNTGTKVAALPEGEEYNYTSGWDYNGNIITTETRRYEDTPHRILLPMDWKLKILSSLHASWICTWMSLPSNLCECATQLYEGNSIAVSDGLFEKDTDISTATWTIKFGNAGRARGG